MEKRGQFYIVAAVIIVLAVSGLASVTTYASVKQGSRTVEDLSLNLKEEGMRVVDYGIYNSDEKIEDFVSEKFASYFLQKTENANVVFIYGNKDSLYGVKYNEVVTGTISASIGGISNWQMMGSYAEKVDISVSGEDYINVEILGNTYEFELRNNEMFYFVIAQEKEDEVYVERN